MPSRLTLFLPEKPEQPIRWIAIDGNGNKEDEGRLDEGLPDWAQELSAIGVADGRAVVTTRVAIPARSRERVRRALPFALEDQLSEDVGTLHFAPGQRDAEGRIAVTVVAHDTMRDWLERLDAAGIELDGLYPEPLILPLAPHSWTLVVDHDGFVLRTDNGQGVAGEHDNMADFLSVALAQVGDDVPESLMVYYEPGTEIPTLPAEAPPASWQPIIDRRALVADRPGRNTEVDLLVGPYQPERKAWLPAAKPWGLVAGLVLIALLLTTGRAWLENHQLSQRVAEQEQRLRSSFQQAFPNRDIATGQMREVMAARLERLRTGASNERLNFLGQLEAIAQSFAGASAVQATALNFRRGNLELEVSADSLQAVDQFKQSLAQRAAGKVAVRSTKRDGDSIRARVTIESNRT